VTTPAVVASPANFQASPAIAVISARRSRRSRAAHATSQYLLDALMFVAVIFAIPFVILLVGAPLALGLRALLWLIGRL
jgi:hypothetical protein